MTPEELVSTTAGPVNALGARFYFDPATLAVGKEKGLDGFRFYVLGRGGVLGNVEPAVVTSAFGYFQPGLIAHIWNSARETLPPREAARVYLGCNADLGRPVLADVAGLAAFCDAAEQVCSDVSPSGLSLYAAVAAEPLPDDLPGRAMQLIVAHRELRGSQHLLANAASRLHPSIAHALRRPDDIKTFGWPEDLEIPSGARAQLDEADRLTNQLAADAYGCLSDEQRDSFAAGVAAIDEAFANS